MINMEVKNSFTFPYEIKDLEPDLNAKMVKNFPGQCNGFVRVGPKEYFYPQKYKEDAAEIYNMDIRPNDIFVNTYPRSGTTLTQEMVWLVANDVDLDKAKAKSLMERFPFLDFHFLTDNTTLMQMMEEYKDEKEIIKILESFGMPKTKLLESTPSPRFIKTHLPMSLLPPGLLDTAKVIFVARDPRDVAVSFYHHNRLIKFHGYDGDFKTYWNLFINGLILYTPFFGVVKEASDKRHHPNMLFMFYEDLNKDIAGGLRRVAEFLCKQLTESQVVALCDHLSIEKFKKNKSVNFYSIESLNLLRPEEEPFIRRGKCGSWRDYFDAEMTQQAERWMADNLRDTDLRFPQYEYILTPQ